MSFESAEKVDQGLIIREFLVYLFRPHGSGKSIVDRRPFASALSSELLLQLLSSCYLAALVLFQCLVSSCCEAGLSSSFRWAFGHAFGHVTISYFFSFLHMNSYYFFSSFRLYLILDQQGHLQNFT